MKLHSKNFKWIFSIGVLLLCFILAEGILRLLGYKAGDLSPRWLNFKVVDSLEVYHSFYTNDKGIFVADSLYFKNEYLINEDGFRDSSFVPDSSRESVLFLGDSYTWGSMAEPMSRCFTEQVENAGYNVYNTGIPGADPAQYLKIAGEYIPKLNPAHVCLMFYAGNDFVSKERLPEPGKNIFYVTNAGWLSPYINDTYNDSPTEVYNYYRHKYHIGSEAPLWKRLVSRSVMGTLALSIPLRLEERKAWQKETRIAVKYVKAIKDICDANKAKFYLFIIPLHTEINKHLSEDYQKIFGSIPVHMPDSISAGDFYPWPNGHLTNSGHDRYVRLILKVIASTTSLP